MSQLGDRNLLFGILALEDYIINRDTLVSAMRIWVADKTKGIAQILREQNALSENHHAVLEERVDKHLSEHGDDPARSLADVRLPDSVRRDLERIEDLDVQASVARVSAKIAVEAPKAETPILVTPTARPAPLVAELAPRKATVAKPRTPAASERSGIPAWLIVVVAGLVVFPFLIGLAAVAFVWFMALRWGEVGIAEVHRPDIRVDVEKPKFIKEADNPKEKPAVNENLIFVPAPAPVVINRKPTAILGDAIWRVEGNELTASNANSKRAYLYLGSKEWSDYDFSFETMSESGRTGPLTVFRAANDANHYAFSLGSFSSGKHSLSRIEKGLLNPDMPPIAAKFFVNTWYRVRIEARGDKIRCFVDDQMVFDYTNGAHPRGQVALGATPDARIRWKNIKVTAPDGKVLWDGLPDLATPKDPAPPVVAAPVDGFVPLFNGKDLTGWKPHAQQPGDWRVVNGILTGFSPGNGYLLTTRGDYKDFHLRVEARTKKAGVVMFRFGQDLQGYETTLNSSGGGMIHIRQAGLPVRNLGRIVPVRGDDWTILEIIAQGNRLQLKVNGKTAVDQLDDQSAFTSGHICLYDFKQAIEFRKIEIKELNAAAPPVVAAPVDGFLPLFNGKDLTGWKEDKPGTGTWRVENGNLVGASNPGRFSSFLSTDKVQPRDFHLRIEGRTERGAGAVILRSPTGRLEGYQSIFQSLNGMLRAGGMSATAPGRTTQLAPIANSKFPAGDWFTLEFIVTGNDLVTKVNGAVTGNIVNNAFPEPGFVVLMPNSQQKIEFRKIEIKAIGVGGAVAPPVNAAPGEFRPLFNGKDLTGWKNDKNLIGDWRVENGVLIGRAAPSRQARLNTEKQYKDFHLRADVRVGDKSLAKIGFRSSDGAIRGYNASMISMAPGGVQVGIINAQTNQKGFTLPRVEMAKIPPGQWFKLEIIAEGNHHVVLVNGKKTTDAVDANIPDAGVIYLSLLGAETIEFRKIEIKELNAGAVAPVFVPAPDFIQLFNGKDLTGWKTHPQLMGNWRVENGVLIGVGGNQGPGRLDSDRAYARDFHLRVEARINEKGSGSVLFRAQDGAFVGYEAPLNASAPFIHKTGSLYGHVPGRRNDLAVAKQSLTAPGEWFMLEVIAEASHLTIKVNGIITVNTLDSSALRAGHLALVSNPNSTVEFRRIEIKAAQ